MFRDDDPLLAIVRRHALALPGAQEKISHGRPAFFTTRVFAYFGGSVRRGPGEFDRHDAGVMVMPDPDDEPALRQDPRFWTPAYLGPYGWLGIDLVDTDETELAELLDASFRRTATRRLVRRLEEDGRT
ncbi:MmcQ/YjbR family DNA-binding protein [Microbacterium sp. EYE_5]|nr:MmcQ/YjbR family DNA-binding protein [Microbacterium sp. EYE_382]MCK6084487.1 MmcQ/YjbR family DNA-binding protein [Microbacterium sp. EYE_384]MCK6123284.1 MmcQ/YjbR family DNA-binding protein [Microbacterium sp. EYE_80]MCK6125251.1 MmcQ/YjbR family DNA-binding protein [Microbacterium sp. EYE_79]MCK6140171.1 MmcQ/YjbR family DNA-binding protein [Microbacterium sp. EYE_39]MCK6216898.1 MmcQ/YjbR family DNA-binding protein [Microbacterium sp. EYE_5]MCK6227615.1 MmcQ/YjbR family DNA-binding pr